MGYLHASDRLWQMDMFRRQASGSTAEILGKDALASDILMRQLGIRRTSEATWNAGELPAALRAELTAYAEGVNARLATLDEKSLPPYFQALGYRPAPWTPVDSLVFSKYMGWDQSGTLDDLWFGAMVEKLGVTAVEELWPLERPYEIPTIKHQFERAKVAASVMSPLSLAACFKTPLPSRGEGRVRGESSRNAGPSPAPLPGGKGDLKQPLPDMAGCFERTLAGLAGVHWLGRGDSFGSNNWAVDGTKTTTGKPMLANDPHLGFTLPSIWYAAHISVNGESVAGVTFAGGPNVIIGHNDRVAWGITNMQADAVDYFVETIHPEDPLRYKHRGEWKQAERITEHVPVRGEAPHELHIDLTVHGPIIRREERAISLAWTGSKPTRDAAALWGMQRARM